MRTKTQPAPRRGGSARGHFVLAVLFTLAAGAAWFSINRENIQEYMETHENREVERAKITELKQRIAQLKRQQQSLAFNGDESEKQIRERLHYHRLGEKVVFFVEDETSGPAAVNSTNQQTTVPAPGEPANEQSQQVDKSGSNTARDHESRGSAAPKGEIQSVYDTLPASTR